MTGYPSGITPPVAVTCQQICSTRYELLDPILSIIEHYALILLELWWHGAMLHVYDFKNC